MRHMPLFGITAKFYIKSETKLKFCQACQVPFAIKESVDQEIDHQVEEGILEPI